MSLLPGAEIQLPCGLTIGTSDLLIVPSLLAWFALPSRMTEQRMQRKSR